MNTTNRMKMKRQLIRIGAEISELELSKSEAFDLLFGGFYEFVYLPDGYSNQLVNGTWTGLLGHIIKGQINGVDFSVLPYVFKAIQIIMEVASSPMRSYRHMELRSNYYSRTIECISVYKCIRS
jgi:hypothetical protein